MFSVPIGAHTKVHTVGEVPHSFYLSCSAGLIFGKDLFSKDVITKLYKVLCL